MPIFRWTHGYSGWFEDTITGLKDKCHHCGNTSEQRIYVEPVGFQLGFAPPFFSCKKPQIGKKKYFLACAICGAVTKEITKEQVDALAGSKNS